MVLHPRLRAEASPDLASRRFPAVDAQKEF